MKERRQTIDASRAIAMREESVELFERAFAPLRCLTDGSCKGTGYRFEKLRTGGADIVGRRMEEAMQAGHAEEVRITGRAHVAQFADRLLLRNQAPRLDRRKVCIDQGHGGRAQYDRTSGSIYLVVAGETLRSGRPGIAGIGRAEMHPDACTLRRRCALLQKQLHAAMTDLMARRGDKDEVARQ